MSTHTLSTLGCFGRKRAQLPKKLLCLPEKAIRRLQAPDDGTPMARAKFAIRRVEYCLGTTREAKRNTYSLYHLHVGKFAPFAVRLLLLLAILLSEPIFVNPANWTRAQL